MKLEAILQQAFGYEKFRPGQREIIAESIKGNHVLGVLATGSGKTLCYQMASSLLPGITLIVSPLISLMEDQWIRFRQQGWKEVGIFHSGLGEERMRQEWIRLKQKKSRLILISPERLTNPNFLQRLKGEEISLLVVDEAHCVSQWGYDFRPDYLQIKEIYPQLKNPPVMALTGTATEKTQQEILTGLGIEGATLIVHSMNRPNISYAVERVDSEVEKKEMLLHRVRQLQGPGIIYVNTRKKAEELSHILSQKLQMEIPAYHGGLPNEDRAIIQNQFMRGEVTILVATTAFGMGIDKENIRYVIHYHIPTSLEGYLQETGRIGRDGNPGIALLYFCEEDLELARYLLDRSLPQLEQIREMITTFLPEHKGSFHSHREEVEEYPIRILLHHLERDGWIKLEKEKDVIHYQWCNPFTEEDMVQLHDEWHKFRIEKHRGLYGLSSLFLNDECIRKGFLHYFNEEVGGYTTFCCSNCGIDWSTYFLSEEKPTLGYKSWDWEEELHRLLPVYPFYIVKDKKIENSYWRQRR